MFQAGRVLTMFVAGLLLLGTAPAAAQPVVSLGGIMANYLELRRQAQLTHKKVLAAESAHAELVAAAARASEVERAADTEWRNQAVRFNQVITDAVQGFTAELLQVSGTSDREDMAAPDSVTESGQSLKTAGTARDAARSKSEVADKAVEHAAADLRRRRDELAKRLTDVRTALDRMTPDQRDVLGLEAANRPDLAVPLGAAGSGSSKVFAPTRGVVTSNFGPRWGATHEGLDIANRIGTPVVSVMDGVVAEAGPAGGFGLWVKIVHTDRTTAIYGHINSYSVRAGQRVGAGQVIAAMGNRGESTGPHLHFEIWDSSGRKVDPLVWLRRKGIMAW
jgi:murein DD-endopeptidase MepM/ murein hydrolase activator NlpD